MKHRSGFLLFISACIPGCGQMYQGYMKRGLSILTSFFTVIALTSFLYLGELALSLPILWLYAFFDTYNIRTHIEAGDAPADEGIFNFSGTDAEKFSELLRNRRSLLGWILIAVGGYALYSTFLQGTLYRLLEDTGLHNLYVFLRYDCPRLVGITAIILLGIWFIRGPKKKVDDTYQSFTPPDFSPKKSEPFEDEKSSDEVSSDAPCYKTVSDAVAQIIYDSKDTEDDKEDRHAGE